MMTAGVDVKCSHAVSCPRRVTGPARSLRSSAPRNVQSNPDRMMTMRRHGLLPTFLFAASLALGACDANEAAKNDGGQTSDPATKTSTGSPEAREHGTAANDTAPHRPGAPASP
jgi:hypothetical protein